MFEQGETATCFFQLSSDTWHLSTIKEVTCELGIKNGIDYEGAELRKCQPYYGRVVVKYRKYY